MKNLEHKDLFAKSIRRSGNTLMALTIGVIILLIVVQLPETVKPVKATDTFVSTGKPWDEKVFSSVDFEGPALNEQVSYGRRLITKTADYLGPNSDLPFAGNNLNCSSCHLDGGTKPFAAPFVAVPGQFPQYRGREDKIGTIQERVNGCMQRSMNGKPLPVDGPEMSAIVAYMDWLSIEAPLGEKIVGNKFLKVDYPDRAVDLKHGASVYVEHCQLCHGEDGQGVRNAEGFTYQYPPLWGEDTYNDGAGMHRVLTAAQFIKGNMPLGTTADEPLLTDEEAYDVAGYINSFKRPTKANKEKDFPDLKRKPMSTPYGPWADEFTAEQHKFGPYQEIAAFYKKEFDMNKSK